MSKLVLMILDGWGHREEQTHNAIASAKTPQWDAWWKSCPHILLEASGEAVGLPKDQMGNSEVGHMHIGAGRVISQEFTRINQAISQGTFDENITLVNAIDEMQRTGNAIHVMGLLSNGGVHSHENHLYAFLKLCSKKQFSNVYLHLFLDGRDTSPQSARSSLARLQEHLQQTSVATISSISGRYFAMDRDKRWPRIELTYRVLVQAQSEYHFETAEEAIASFYQHEIYDEFIPPTIIGKASPIKDGDSVFFFNFRSDRARQLTEALISQTFDGFDRQVKPQISHFISMTSYAKTLQTEPVFPPILLHNTLGEVVANHGMRQLRIAETEKYAHVTFFLNGGIEQAFPHEDRLLIPSPKIATYDLQPEMSAVALTKALTEAIQSQSYDLIICNYANADMIGHTGDMTATIKAIEYLDKAMHTVWTTLKSVGGQLLITADHGNAECMYDEATHQAHTAHTTEPVPLLYIGGHLQFNTTYGSLIDIAPTVLTLLNITPPSEMTGHSLLVEKNATHG